MENLIQNTPEWLEWRRKKIGASDCAVIMGISPWKTPHQLYEEKVFGTKEKNNSAMNRGKVLEEIARKIYERITNKSFWPQVVTHSEFDWMVASMDGLTLDSSEAVEIKCPSYAIYEMALAGIIPDYYIAQLQHQMFVCDLEKIDYFVYVDDQHNVIVPVKLDLAYCETLFEKEKEFYEMVMNQIAPELTHKDYVQRSDMEWLDASQDWKMAKKDLTIAQDREERERSRLLLLCCDKSSRGHGVSVKKVVKQGAIDFSRIESLKDIDLNQYRKEHSTYFQVREDGLHEL